MPNATVRANARTLPEATNRRAVLGAVLAAGVAGATAVLPAYAAPGPVALSPIDRRVLDLWQRYQKLRTDMDGVLDESGWAALDEMGAEFCAIQGKIDEHLGASVVALAIVLMGAIYDRSDEALPGLNRASLRAIRPQLVGTVAEAADRVLAAPQAEEDA
jgi:hypothetical protein